MESFLNYIEAQSWEIQTILHNVQHKIKWTLQDDLKKKKIVNFVESVLMKTLKNFEIIATSPTETLVNLAMLVTYFVIGVI